MQPRLTQVPPSAAFSATATRAPRSAAMRAARTPALPAPIRKRSKPASLIRARRRSLERLLEQLRDQAVDTVRMRRAALAQRRGEVGRQLARERHEPGGGVDPALLAPVDHRGGTLAEPAGRACSLHLSSDLLGHQLVEIGLLHAHGDRPASSKRRLSRAVAQSVDGPESCLLYTSPSPRDGLLSR